MNYYIFNKWVFEYYCSTNTENSICCLAIDEYVIDQFKSQYSLSQLHFDEIRNFPWSKLLQTNASPVDNVPGYFGLIALQCLAAASMENSDDLSSGNYNKRFCKIAGVDEAKLNSFYSETYNSLPVQDYIWKRAKAFLWNSFGFQINIPAGTVGPGRYIQYPKAQVILNKQDLKEIAQKVFIDLSNDDALITEDDFRIRFLRKFALNAFVRKNNQSKHIGPFKGIFLKQVFNYFNSNDWQLEDYFKNEHSDRKRRDKYVVEFGLDEKPHFFHNSTKEIEHPVELFKEQTTYIFRKLETEEYEESSFFYLNEELLFVSTLPLFFGEKVIHDHDGVNIAKCNFRDTTEVPQNFTDQLKDEKSLFPIKLQGPRVGHGWNYIQGLGPEIIGEKYSVWYSSYEEPFSKVLLEDYNPFTCISGLYTILIPGTRNLEFRILDYKYVVDNGVSNGGLSLKNFVLNDGGALLSGLRLSGSLTDDKAPTINYWVQANLGSLKSSKSNFLKSIINYNHDR